MAGEEYALRYDLDAQIGTVTTLKIMNPGFQNITWWRFLDAPYDTLEIAVLLMHGINGAKRYNKDTKLIKIEEAKKLLEDHFNYIYGQASDIEDEEEAMKFVQGEQTKLFSALQDATRAGVGFRKARKKCQTPTPSESLSQPS